MVKRARGFSSRNCSNMPQEITASPMREEVMNRIFFMQGRV